MALLVALGLLVLALPAFCAPPRPTLVQVLKSERVLRVYAGDQVLASYPVALGGQPLGHKTRQGDRRTPEGRYMLDYRNPRSAYFLSIHVSYPDRADREQARRRGVDPGGDIMIHGQPNNAAFRQYLQLRPGLDWTDGCIALSDADMQALWDLIPVPLPIEILP